MTSRRALAAGISAALLLLGLALTPLPTRAAEEVRVFAAEIEVAPDGDLIVSERIEVKAEGRDIRRGIYRDLTIETPTGLGLIRPELEILQVRRDSEPEPYHTERSEKGVRIYIGDRDVQLRPGVYSYLLRYRIADQIGFQEGYDEVYWNVTGSGWNFPIRYATATVLPPQGFEIVSHAAYTGRHGESGQAYSYRLDDQGYPRWETTAPLAPGQGLTVAVSWQKGLIAEPDTGDRLLTALIYNRSSLIALAALGVILLYYLGVWRLVGRDPQKGPIVPVYEAELPPAAMRFIYRKGFDRTAFVAALINMAVKSHLRIVEIGDGYRLEEIRGDAGKRPLSDGEAKAFRRLFSSGPLLELEKSNRTPLTKAQSALSDHLRGVYDRAFFSTNRIYFFCGLAITLIAWIAVAFSAGDQYTAIFLSVWLSFWTVGTGLLVLRALKAWREVLGGALGDAPGAVILSVFSAPFVVGWVVGAGFLFTAIGLTPTVFLVIVALINILFFELLEAHTPLGRKVVDEIEGLKLYLSVAEKDRLEFHNPPDRTPEHFEEMLPYALALGVENSWAAQFDSVFAEAARAQGEYQPRWYVGRGFSVHNLHGFSSGFSSSLANASSAPSKSGSGGSFGGGFSGGGGGGGGGGGW